MKAPRTSILALCIAMTLMAGLGAGCNNTAEQIPLADVPPPPPGFGEAKKSPNAPKGGSPSNVSDITK